MTAPVEKVRAADLVERLRRHYIRRSDFPGGIFIPEVGINGGWRNGQGGNRRCDAVHVGFTSSSGQLLTGHEVKISRSDFLHELDQPDKALQWADNCHAWYLVTPRNLVKPEEVPHGWGLMEPGAGKSTRMVIVKPAKLFEDRVPDWTIVRSIMARLDTLTTAALGQAVRDRDDAQRDAVRWQREAEQVERPATAADPRAVLAERLLEAWDSGAQKLQDKGHAGWLFPQQHLAEIVGAALDLADAKRQTANLRSRLAQLGYTAQQLESLARQLREVAASTSPLIEAAS